MSRFTKEAMEAVFNHVELTRHKIEKMNTKINPSDLEVFLIEVRDEIKFCALQLSRGRGAGVVEKLDVDDALRKLVIALSRNRRIFSSHYDQILACIQILKERIEASAVPMVLDAGCGWGRVSRTLSKYLNDKAEIVGIDLDILSLQYGKSLSDNTQFIRAHMEFLPFIDKVFEAVLSSRALHEIEIENERRKTIGEFARTIKQGGTIYIHDNFARLSVTRLIQRLLHTIFPRVEVYSETGEFEKNLSADGFTTIRKNHVSWPMFSLTVLGSYIAVRK